MGHDSSEFTGALTLYNELLLAGREPNIDEFCARYPNNPGLRQRLQEMGRVQRRLYDLLPGGAPPEIPEFADTLRTRIRDLEIIREIGKGGMGTVYLAKDSLGELRAVKLIHLPSLSFVQRFDREASILLRLDQDCIPKCHGFGIEKDTGFIVFDWVDGLSLDRLLESIAPQAADHSADWYIAALEFVAKDTIVLERAKARGSISTIVDVIHDIAWAVGHAHEKGVVHRDIKPANIMVTFGGEVKLIDFGIAVGIDAPETHLTKTGSFVGSPSYAAPEQLVADPKAIGPPTDTYALCATLFELLTRVRYSSLFETRLDRVNYRPPKGPRDFNPRVSRALNAIIRRGLSPRPADRIPDGIALAKEIRRSPWLDDPQSQDAASVSPPDRVATVDLTPPDRRATADLLSPDIRQRAPNASPDGAIGHHAPLSALRMVAEKPGGVPSPLGKPPLRSSIAGVAPPDKAAIAQPQASPSSEGWKFHNLPSENGTLPLAGILPSVDFVEAELLNEEPSASVGSPDPWRGGEKSRESSVVGATQAMQPERASPVRGQQTEGSAPASEPISRHAAGPTGTDLLSVELAALKPALAEPQPAPNASANASPPTKARKNRWLGVLLTGLLPHKFDGIGPGPFWRPELPNPDLLTYARREMSG